MEERNKVEECRLFYGSTRKNPIVMRFEIKMNEEIDFLCFESAVKTALKRYPYFRVALSKIGDDYYFVDNDREVIVAPSNDLLEINSESTNFHQLYFSAEKDTIVVNIFHALTDGDGAYALIKTVLYYYFSDKYKISLSKDNIRLYGDPLGEEEYLNPLSQIALPTPKRRRLDPIYQIPSSSTSPSLYHLRFDEASFIAKTRAIGATPNVLMAVMLDKAIRDTFDVGGQKTRIVVCVNERGALKAPLAHQSFVGGALLDFSCDDHRLDLSSLSQKVRAELKRQSADEIVLNGLSLRKAYNDYVFSVNDQKKRHDIVSSTEKASFSSMNAVISYVGKANFGDTEKYIVDFKTIASPTSPILAELSAVNGHIYLDLSLTFPEEPFLSSFLCLAAKIGIFAQSKEKIDAKLPNVKLPWDSD